MSRIEVIGIIQKMTKAYFEKVEQHWYYCRREKKLPELKNYSDLRTAQTTTGVVQQQSEGVGMRTQGKLRAHGNYKTGRARK